MKRKSIIAILAAVMVLASSAISFAATDLHIVSSYPKDGQTNTSMENLGVKIVFSNQVNDEKIQKDNAKSVKLVDKDGKKVPIDVLFSDKTNSKMILVVADTNKYKVLNNSEYTLTIGKNFTDNDGNKLGKAETITFKTYNQTMNNLVNTGMMVVMFGGLFFVSMRANNKKKEEEQEADKPAEAFNPYKEAKRTGKTVEEIKAEQAKKEEKLAKKKSKKKEEPVYEKHIENCAELLNNVYHVHAPAPVSKEDRSIAALEKLRKDKKAAAKAAAAAKKKKKK